jgi:ligand-binding SRPBCC domain-containing protein
MNIYSMHREQCLPIPVEQAWAFFSSAGNLSKITPPEMKFVILSAPDDRPIYTGMTINYIVRPLLNIPLKWTTEILSVHAPYTFTDKQLRGPYALWEHTHTFITVERGVKMTDDVKYALPLGWIGTVAHTMAVEKKLGEIFNFRAAALKQLFGDYK